MADDGLEREARYGERGLTRKPTYPENTSAALPPASTNSLSPALTCSINVSVSPRWKSRISQCSSAVVGPSQMPWQQTTMSCVGREVVSSLLPLPARLEAVGVADGGGLAPASGSAAMPIDDGEGGERAGNGMAVMLEMEDGREGEARDG